MHGYPAVVTPQMFCSLRVGAIFVAFTRVLLACFMCLVRDHGQLLTIWVNVRNNNDQQFATSRWKGERACRSRGVSTSAFIIPRWASNSQVDDPYTQGSEGGVNIENSYVAYTIHLSLIKYLLLTMGPLLLIHIH